MINLKNYQDKFQHKDLIVFNNKLELKIYIKKKLVLMKGSSILIELNGDFELLNVRVIKFDL